MSATTPDWLQALDLSRFRIRPGATQTEIDRAEAVLNCLFPSDYREFLLATDGCEVMNGDELRVVISPLWSPLEDDLAVVGDNEHCQDVTWPVKIFQKGSHRCGSPLESNVSLIHIGTDDADQGIVFLRQDLSTRTDKCPVYCFIQEELECVECASSFRELIGVLGELQGDQDFSPLYAKTIIKPSASSSRRSWWQFWRRHE